MARRKILVTGATGYIGGRLVPCLLEKGYPIRCLVRDPDRLRGRTWEDQVEIVQGDVLHYETLVPALEGVDAAHRRPQRAPVSDAGAGGPREYGPHHRDRR